MADVEIERHGEAVAALRLNRPRVLNALSWGLVRALHEALDELQADNRCRVVVLTGSGRGFCAGLDLRDQDNTGELTEGARGPRAGMLAQEYIAGLIPHLRRIQQPLIAAINGPAYGGGPALALGCDIRIAAESAQLCVQFIRVGVSGCDIGVSYLLPKLIGASLAHDLILTGRPFDAREALELGVVTRLVPDEELLPSALRLAEELCELNPFGLVMTKEAMWANLDAPSLEAAIQLENRNQILVGSQGSTREAAAAFFEKRKPRWAEEG
ncbi:MAG: enoyl-CoA hydratase/isomerase family protein [Proteobacteria bacterium]|nr:enoyl-CoA hydratase/isomerase family protein [Pseudomonadota bacterium]